MARRLNLSSRAWRQDELELLRGMAVSGLTMDRAATALGRAYCAVASKAMREGIRFGHKGGHRIPRISKDEGDRLRITRASAMLRDAILAAANHGQKTLDVGCGRRRESR